MRAPSADRDDGTAGSATVWTLSVATAVGALCWVVLLVALAVASRHRAEAAADLAALAGASAAEYGLDGCRAAAGVAEANHARIESCVVAGDETVTVAVGVPLPAQVARWVSGEAVATARAGP